MIFFDTTRTGGRDRRSGLDRVSARLRESLGDEALAVVWKQGLREAGTGKPVTLCAGDTFLTSELFSEAERPGFTRFIAEGPGHRAAVFHDAIPLKHPHIIWPRSVARQPGYMKLLASFNRIWAVSEASRTDLLGFWAWQGIERPPPVDVLTLGADFNGMPRFIARVAPAAIPKPPRVEAAPAVPRLLCLGIIEPRKNQQFLLEVCADLWTEGLSFELHIVGRVNPHFGAPTVARLKALRRVHSAALHFHEAANDATVGKLYATTRASVFPTIAEGCGLPLLESLWMGVPCVCSDLPVLRENAGGGGCLVVAPNDRAAWKAALRRVLTDTALHSRLVNEACSRSLPTWNDAAHALLAALR